MTARRQHPVGLWIYIASNFFILVTAIFHITYVKSVSETIPDAAELF